MISSALLAACERHKLCLQSQMVRKLMRMSRRQPYTQNHGMKSWYVFWRMLERTRVDGLETSGLKMLT